MPEQGRGRQNRGLDPEDVGTEIQGTDSLCPAEIPLAFRQPPLGTDQAAEGLAPRPGLESFPSPFPEPAFPSGIGPILDEVPELPGRREFGKDRAAALPGRGFEDPLPAVGDPPGNGPSLRAFEAKHLESPNSEFGTVSEASLHPLPLGWGEGQGQLPNRLRDRDGRGVEKDLGPLGGETEDFPPGFPPFPVEEAEPRARTEAEDPAEMAGEWSGQDMPAGLQLGEEIPVRHRVREV